ncbi:MAG: hypothetical protein EG828_16165, partial [Deltaproteobacteria bacterium]|nr:hypothetical protein [Deltaproteobacteria bacterium]
MSTEDNALYRFNTTEEYHRQDLESLGWELTVCNSLYPANTPIRKILKKNASYGELLYDFLRSHIPFENITQVLEIGGGYGFLMKDLIKVNPRIRPSMLDISPALLKKQEEALAGHDAAYCLSDALAMDEAFFKGFELVIFNENLGDFPALVEVDPVVLDSDEKPGPDAMIERVRHFFAAYRLQKPSFRFNLNIGAMQMLEKVCEASVPYIFIGEHS